VVQVFGGATGGSKEPFVDKHDVVVVGGGMAGMVCANYLVSLGRSVMVIEQNHHTGGNMSGFRRQGYTFDGGDQSFESLGLVFPILRELGILEQQEWTKVRYRFVSPDFDFFLDDFESVEEALRRAFPRETGFGPLFAEAKVVSRFISEQCDAWGFPLLEHPTPARIIRFLKWLPRLRRWVTYRYRLEACSVIQDPALRQWFSQIGYYHMPYLFFGGFWHLWMKDYWYPVGGMQALHDRLARRFTQAGGSLRCNATVSRIAVERGRAVGAVTSEGEEIRGGRVVYAGDYKRLVGGLLEESLFRPSFVSKIRSARLTESLLNVYLGLNRSVEQLEPLLHAHHIFYFPSYEVVFPDRHSDRDVHRRMWVTANFFGKENPGFAPPGKSTLVLQTYSSYDWQNHWGNGSGSRGRTEEYRRLKDEVGGQLVELAENLLPRLGSWIDYFEVGTPLSIERFSLNTDGSTGGWCYEDTVSPVYRLPWLNLFRTPVRGLTAAGHYALWPGGVISAALSGKMAANLVAGRWPMAGLGAG
jgi:phytoene dehydrogenase-like protein